MKRCAGRVPRLYVAEGLRQGANLDLPDDASHHAIRVLRLGAGDEIALFDGRGGEYEARIAAAARKRATVEVGAHHAIERESPLLLTLIQGLPGGDRMDFIIQKAVELGVAVIQPVHSEKSLVRLSRERGAAKLAHWQRVAIAACEQCGRNRIPEIRAALSLKAYCAAPDEAPLRLVLSPRGEARLAERAAPGARAVALAAGPEAGFGADDEALLIAAGFVPVRLGPRILRTETAALAALAALNALRGDF